MDSGSIEYESEIALLRDEILQMRKIVESGLAAARQTGLEFQSGAMWDDELVVGFGEEALPRIRKTISFHSVVRGDPDDEGTKKVFVDRGWIGIGREWGEYAGGAVEVPETDGFYWIYAEVTRKEEIEEDKPQWDIDVKCTEKEEPGPYQEYPLPEGSEIIRVLCHVKRDGDALSMVWHNHEGDLPSGGGGGTWNGKTQFANDDGSSYDLEALTTPTTSPTSAHGEYLMGDLYDGSSELTDDPGSYDASQWHKWHVADRTGSGTVEDPYVYALSPDTVGTIHIGKR